MKKLGDHGSIVPIVVFFIVIILFGLLHGIFSYMMTAVEDIEDPLIDVGGGTTVDVNAGMNSIMGNVWLILVIIVLIIATSWLLIMAQKERYGGGI